MYAISWSGGKDGCLAYWKAKTDGLSIGYVLNTYRRDTGRVAFHGVRAEFIRVQSDALGIPLYQIGVGDNDYEARFQEALSDLRGKGVEGIVFGDIDVRQNRDWCEGVCRRVGLESIFPLWMQDQKSIMEEFVGTGFKAIVVALNSRFLRREDLGRTLDGGWLERIEALRRGSKENPITYCGENGEYHTFVYGGPAFSHEIGFAPGGIVSNGDYYLMDLIPMSTMETRST
ncbi:MAG TPA: diphthine--ammonia ligase [Thermoplasmata archaeon]|nr:diphthine--ammonia ligase [Thermoplasmata archaeon]